MTDQEKITALRDALARIADQRNTHFAGDAQVVARHALAMTADASEPSSEPVAWMCPNDPDAASAFKWAKPGVDYSGLSCDACGGKHVRVFATPPTADSAADARAKEAYDYRHLTQVAQGMGFEDIAGALTDLVRLRGTADDTKRLDWLGEHCTGASDSERYLPFRVYWGNKGATQGIRAQLDKAMPPKSVTADGEGI